MIKYFLFLFILFSSSLFGQIDSSFTIDEYMSFFISESIINEDDDLFINQIEELLKNPIDLNKADFTNLSSIPFLSNEQMNLILQYREKNGKFFSKFELMNIDGLNKLIVRAILPLTFIKKTKDNIDENKAKYFENNLNFRVRNRIQNKGGNTKENIFSPANKIYNRFSGRYSNYQVGITTEKDFNEKNIIDYYSFYLESDNFIVDKLIAGDFLLYFGNGLAIWNPYRIYKPSINTTNAIKNKTNLIPYQSTDENKFFRGLAIKHNFGVLSASIFYSQNFLDGKYDTLSKAFKLKLDGIHAAKNEIALKNDIKNIVYGSTIGINIWDNFITNFLFYENILKFDRHIEKQNAFSAFYSLMLNKLIISGENAFVNRKLKSICSVNFLVLKNLNSTFSLRSYSKNAVNYWANGFGESTNHAGEFGFYSAIDWTNSFADLSCYFDQYRIEDNESIDYELIGRELMFNISSNLSNKFIFSFRYFFENKETFANHVNQNLNVNSSRFRFDFTYFINRKVNNKCRVELSKSSSKESRSTKKGFLIYDEIQAKTLADKLSISIRFTLFSTDNYDSKIYSFENDLPGLMTVLPFYNDGLRWYFLISYSPIKYLKISLKYSELFKNKSISRDSGLIIQTISKNTINLQTDFSF